MTRSIATCALLCIIGSTSLHAQFRGARSADYLFLTSVTDIRATWVNPAGLAVVPEASILGEAVVARMPNGDFHFDQYTIGFNSRGLSVAYQRDRFDNGPSTNIVRISSGLPMARGALGVAASWYAGEGPNDRDFDVGFLYSLTQTVLVGLTARHIGRAVVADVKMPLIFAGGAGITLLNGRLLAAGEGRATERLTVSGYDLSYRAGAFFVIPTPRPIMLLAAGDLGSNFEFDRLHIGISVGGRSSVTGVVSGVQRNDSPVLDRVSVSGVASNVLAGRR